MSLLLKVRVTDAHINLRSGIAKSSGKPYEMRVQENIFVEMGGEVRKMPIVLQENRPSYPPGNYTIDIEPHLTLSRFDQLEFRPFSQYELISVAEKSALPFPKTA